MHRFLDGALTVNRLLLTSVNKSSLFDLEFVTLFFFADLIGTHRGFIFFILNGKSSNITSRATRREIRRKNPLEND